MNIKKLSFLLLIIFVVSGCSIGTNINKSKNVNSNIVEQKDLTREQILEEKLINIVNNVFKEDSHYKKMEIQEGGMDSQDTKILTINIYIKNINKDTWILDTGIASAKIFYEIYNTSYLDNPNVKIMYFKPSLNVQTQQPTNQPIIRYEINKEIYNKIIWSDIETKNFCDVINATKPHKIITETGHTRYLPRPCELMFELL